MSARKASFSLQKIPIGARLFEPALPVVEARGEALEWKGRVRLAEERAGGLSAPYWQAHVRRGLFERALVLGAEHREGPHTERPEIGRRLLAHLDALAEAGLSFEDITAFGEEMELDRPGALWMTTLLFGCLDVPSSEEAFEAWVGALDEALFLDYRAVEEIAAALEIQPNEALRRRAVEWVESASASFRAIALETRWVAPLLGDRLVRLARDERPLVQAALERHLCRASEETLRALPPRPRWSDIPSPALCYEVAKARLLRRDTEALVRLRAREPRALAALGPFTIDLLALAGEGSDGELAAELVRGFASAPHLLDAMGRAGLPLLLPRLLAELGGDALEDEAHEALMTMFGPRVERPSRKAWEQVIAALPGDDGALRLRGGEAYSLSSVLRESARPGLSEIDLRRRADELGVITGKRAEVGLGVFGSSLEGALAGLGLRAT